jgi:hypothetical protein
MTEYKGTAITFLRSLLSEQPESVQRSFESAPSSEDIEQFRSVLAISNIPIAYATRLYLAAAPALYPDDAVEIGLRRIGRALARDNLSGIYRLVLKVLTVSMLIAQCARLWRTYHSTGNASTRRVSDKHYLLLVTDCPDLPELYREFVCGFVEGAITQTGGRDPRVTKAGKPSEWSWDVTWR